MSNGQVSGQGEKVRLENLITELQAKLEEYEKQTGFVASINLLMLENSNLLKSLEAAEGNIEFLSGGNSHLMDKLEAAEAKLARIAEVAEYANYQADNAQIRLLNQDKPLYDDTYWQPVLDRIRFDLLNLELITGERNER